ncbi:MAG: ribosomal protein S18-alanine N-acetyltransferase [Gemmatimonadetes bacterium]|nr:ribosomal protein S18-alanine N-acetyltransferase [Gemmatimonadota bacterium]
MRQRVPGWIGRVDSRIPQRKAALVLRPMRRRDVPEVMEIERGSFSAPWSAFTFRSLLRRRNAVLLVAEEGERIAGYAVLWIASNVAELGNLAVRPAFRGQGTGRALLDEALREAAAEGARTVVLEVRESNEAARQLYAGAGFRIVGVRSDYYVSPREDALVMRIRLDSSDVSSDRRSLR